MPGTGLRAPFCLEPLDRLPAWTGERSNPILAKPTALVSSLPVVTITRRLRFNAAHRIHNPALSDGENAALYGKCNNPHGHGHNYTLEVSLTGPVDPRSGYVLDLGVVRDIVEREVIGKLDHRNLNLDVDFLMGVNPTSENLVVAIWRELQPRLAPATLSRLRLWETEHNCVEYDGAEI